MNPKVEYKQLAEELDGLRGKETYSAEETKRLGEILSRMKELEPVIDALVAADEQATKAGKYQFSQGRPSERETPEAAEGKGEGGKESHSVKGPERFSRIIMRSDRYKRYVQDRVGPAQIPVGSFYYSQGLDEDGEPTYIRNADRYALVGENEPATLITPQRIPGIAMATMVRPTVRDAFANSPTSSNLVQFIREDVENNDNAADFFDETDTSEGNVKPESTLRFEEDEAPVRTIATTLPVTDNIVDDVPGFQALLNGRLLDFIKEAEDDALLNGDGTPPAITGLLETSGIQVLDDAYFNTALNGGPLPDASEVNADINRLTHAITAIRENGLAEPTFFIMSPAALDYFLMITDDNRNYLAGNPFTTVSIPRFRGLPIIVSNKLADDHAVVGASNMAEVRDRMTAKVDVGWVDKQFAKNQKTLRAEERLAFAVLRPAAFADITLNLA